MIAQPSGTVTLVFTDIEGSTMLLEELGVEAYRAALAEHRRIVREACGRHQGYEVDTEGDAFFYAFGSAQAAVSAVSAAMQGLDGGPIRIRVGIHTGHPELDPPGYIGMDVHRAARIMASGHGGQVVLSPTTVALLDGTVALKPLGEHRLKDMSAPLALSQLLIEGLPDAFPPLKTLYHSNLPVPTTPFLGREAELAEVHTLLTDPTTRLLTLAGPGGTGKTRLALQAVADASDQFPDGTRWIPLAPIREPVLVLPTVASACELSEHPGEAPVETIARAFAGKRALVVIDNLEHLLPDAADAIGSLLAGCPTLRVLVTSRERLQLAAEREYLVDSLTLADAVGLLRERAAAVGVELADDDDARVLVERLERLPLAIELAAARLKLFTPTQLVERLGDRLDSLKGARDADPRQQTLRATVAWSYDLLDPGEKQLLCRLSSFRGGCTLEAAEAVCDAEHDGLQSLLDKSLLRRSDTPTGPRIWVLETIREYAAEVLARSGECDDIHLRHARWAQALVEQAEPELAAGEQRVWLERLTAELDNLRAALACLEAEPVEQLRMSTSLWRFWQARGHLAEARLWLEPTPELADAAGSDLAVRGYVAASRMAWKQGDEPVGRAHAEEAWQRAAQANDDRLMALAAENLGVVAALSDRARGHELLRESVEHFRKAEDRIGLASALNNLGCVQLELGDAHAAAAAIEESIALSRATRNESGLAYALHSLGLVRLHDRKPAEARPLLEEALSLACELGDEASIGDSFEALGHCAGWAGDARRAAMLWGAADAVRRRGGFDHEVLLQMLLDAARPVVEGQLGTEAFAAALAEGRARSVDDILELALGST